MPVSPALMPGAQRLQHQCLTFFTPGESMNSRDLLAAAALCLIAVPTSANLQGAPNSGNGTFIVVDANNHEIGLVVEHPLSDAPSVIRDVPGAPLIALFLDHNLLRAPDQAQDALYFTADDCTGDPLMLAASPYLFPRAFAIQDEPVIVPDESAVPASVTTNSRRIAQGVGICQQLVRSTEFVPILVTSYVLPTFTPPFRLTTRSRSAPSLAAVPSWAAALLVGVLIGISIRKIHAPSGRVLM